jgi:2-desacetyl-2-hydroxyethyl bacteriochlorophyllide A dehydrogenase
MRAAIMRGNRIIVDEFADPVPRTGELLVRTRACGICGSDVHMLERHGDNSPSPAGFDVRGDVVMGHEFCCEVVDYGPQTSRRVKAGQLVCSVPILPRPEGPEFVGYNTRNPGGYGQYMRLSERLVVAVPNGLSAAHAALTEPMAVGYHAVELAQTKPDDAALVIGCGPVGLGVIAALRLKGVHPIVAANSSPLRREIARAIGADIVVDPTEASPFEAWRKAAAGGWPDPGPNLPGWLVGSPYRPAVIFECAGGPGLIDQLIAEAPQDARIVVAGLCHGPDTFHPLAAVHKEINLRFSNSYTREHFATTLRLIGEGLLDVRPMITATVGLSGVAQAFEDLRARRQAKVLIEPWRH